MAQLWVFVKLKLTKEYKKTPRAEESNPPESDQEGVC